MEQKIKKIIENEVNPMLKADGGLVEFVGYESGIVRVQLQGACATCPFSAMTLQNLVEKTLKSKIPEIKKVVQH